VTGVLCQVQTGRVCPALVYVRVARSLLLDNIGLKFNSLHFTNCSKQSSHPVLISTYSDIHVTICELRNYGPVFGHRPALRLPTTRRSTQDYRSQGGWPGPARPAARSIPYDTLLRACWHVNASNFLFDRAYSETIIVLFADLCPNIVRGYHVELPGRRTPKFGVWLSWPVIGLTFIYHKSVEVFLRGKWEVWRRESGWPAYTVYLVCWSITAH
jgi:hypothetical protein